MRLILETGDNARRPPDFGLFLIVGNLKTRETMSFPAYRGTPEVFKN